MNVKTLIVSLFLLIFTFVSHATLITTDANTSFRDLGNSTVDLQSNLEWLDLTETVNRSYNEVLFDINNDGGQFDIADRWRFASRADFSILVGNFFGTPFTTDSSSSNLFSSNYDDFALDDSLSVEAFIMLLGDTVNFGLDFINFQFDISNNGAGGFEGILADIRNDTSHYGAFARDNERVVRSTGEFASDADDIIYNGAIVNGLDDRTPFRGSFLVREFTEVPEPSTIGIFLLAFFALVVRQCRLIIKHFFTLSLFAFVTACGGGSGGSNGNSGTPQPAPTQPSTPTQPTNTPPTANAGVDQTVNEGTQVTLVGSGTDSDGSIASYYWVQMSGPSVTLSDVTQEKINFAAPVVLMNEGIVELVFELTVTDNTSSQAKDIISIFVEPVNLKPTVGISPLPYTLSKRENNMMTVSAEDVDGEVVAYEWQQIEGREVKLVANSPEKKMVSYIAPEVERQEILRFVVKAKDNEGGESQAEIETVIYPIDSNMDFQSASAIDINSANGEIFPPPKLDNPEDKDFFELTWNLLNPSEYFNILPIPYVIKVIPEVNKSLSCQVDVDGLFNSSFVGEVDESTGVCEIRASYFNLTLNEQGREKAYLITESSKSDVVEYQIDFDLADIPSDLGNGQLHRVFPNIINIENRKTGYLSVLDSKGDIDSISIVFEKSNPAEIVNTFNYAVSVRSLFSPNVGVLDPYCRLFDESLVLIGEDDDTILNDCVVSGSANIKDILHLEISSFAQNSAGMYVVEIQIF